ncbi:carbohydrate ABC transporter permease [Pseudothermotoga sp.]|nr:sugar ABC transporter permease [Pseudothermotoga sp.]MCX7813442.1 sugar ABC transporter permease [Pseudothermotoga sp.]MDW8139570.1 sugar ABC transporter permease [Pseudothermotoga sp.]
MHLFFVLPATVVVMAVSIFPAIYAVYLSFTNRRLMWLGTMKFLGLENYSRMFNDSLFLHSLRLQFTFMALAIPIELIIGFLVALLFLKDFPLSRLLRSLLMLPVYVLPVVSGLTWRLMLQPEYGMLGKLFKQISLGPAAWLADVRFAFVAVVLQDVWRMWPFMFMVLYAGLTSIPNEYLEAAQLDGATPFQRLFWVIIPLIKPVIVTALLLRLIDALRIFSEVYVMTYGGPSNATMLLPLYIHRRAFEFGEIGYGSALGVFLMIVSLLITYQLIKRSMRGELA